jgi:hypothetical protein
MVTKAEAFPSRFTKAADLPTPVIAKIDFVGMEMLDNGNGSQKKHVVHFQDGVSKPLVLNGTNFDLIAAIANDGDSDNWGDVEIELYATTTDLRGKPTDCVRVRAPRRRAKAVPKPPHGNGTPPADGDPDDAIPF